MNDDEWVARADFVLLRQDGSRSPVSVRIAAPRSAGPGEWSCRLALDGLYDQLLPVSGTDSLQALGLAWRLAGMLLARIQDRGGRLMFENGESVPLSAYFDDPLTPPHAHDRAL